MRLLDHLDQIISWSKRSLWHYIAASLQPRFLTRSAESLLRATHTAFLHTVFFELPTHSSSSSYSHSLVLRVTHAVFFFEPFTLIGNMVWLETKDVKALEHATDTLRSIRDGQVKDPSYLSNLSRPLFGFRVTKAFNSYILKRRFLPGMEGVVFRCEDEAAYVKARDLFGTDRQPLKDWVPHEAIEIGTRPYDTWQAVAPSPISKERPHEGSQWLRTDGSMPDKSGETVPVSNFARTARKRATLSTDANGDLLVIFEISREKTEDKPSYSFRMTRTAAGRSDFDDIAWPAEGTLYNVRFEVRKDWKPHEYSWARLPLYGPFEDWDRANSWGVCLEWTDKTGQHRCRYLHCERPFVMLDDLSYGSIQAYARGIEVRSSNAHITPTHQRKHPTGAFPAQHR
jgi:hypothetical protein